ncbi:hypothetical protein [Zestomonas thermotolerans]|nr:hypothetical protein [Pseudomonas thermotolerans]
MDLVLGLLFSWSAPGAAGRHAPRAFGQEKSRLRASPFLFDQVIEIKGIF